MLTSDTKRRLDSCRDLLVGKLPLPSDQVELITLALIYKFMDDLDEESVELGGKRSFFTGSLAPFRWRAVVAQTLPAEERVTLFSGGLEAMGNAKTGAHLPALFRDIFRNAFLKFRDGRILTLFLNEVNGFAYSHSEELGNAFEYLLQCMGTQGENGQFRTPRHIIDFIVGCLDPQPGDKILDPACGTGGFLVSAYKHILNKNTSPGSTVPGDRLGRDQFTRLYGNLTGYDITDLMVKLSKVNLFLHGFPDPAVHIYDSLSNDARWHEKADLILANPPFMTPKGGVTPHTRFRIPAKKAEVLFTDYIAEHLSPDGRAGIIVPNGIVATTQNAYVKLRRFLVEDSLVAVVSLPSGVFKPYSGVKTSILFLDKKLARRTDDILFLKVSADGFDLGDQRRAIAANDLPLAKRYLDRWFEGSLGDEPPAEIPFKRVAKRGLLASRACNLDVGEISDSAKQTNGEVDFVNVAELLQDVSLSTKIQKNQFLPSGRFPIVDQSENFIAGYWNDESDVFRVTRPIVVFGDHTRRFKYIDFDFVLGADGVKVLQFDERVLPRYAYFALGALKLRDLGYSRHYKELVGHQIPLPPLEEQRRIVTEIEAYQQVIDGARQILAAYRPAFDVALDCSTVPVGGFAKVGGAIRKEIDPALPYIGSDSIESGTGTLLQKKSCAEQGIQGPVYEFEGPRLLYSKIRPYLNKLTLTDFHGYCSSDVYPLLIDETKVLRHFLAYYFLSPSFLAAIAGFHERVSIPKINREQLFSVPVPLPPLAEQERIVAELDAEAARIEAVRGLIPVFEAKIQRTLDRVWGAA